tara:strand:- start:688 stop:1278 length:591 start_codon:yes stop_codon:yes gene_type:complete
MYNERSEHGKNVKVLKAITYRPPPKAPEVQRPLSIRLMRVNYAGEVAAQGLYLGALCFAKEQYLQQFCRHAADEEFAHLEWCGQRVSSLGGDVSVFNPLFFAGAFVLGGVSSLCGAEYALGFVEETEKQVLKHLRKHEQRLPMDDRTSRKIIAQMIEDEAEHGNEASMLGAAPLPKPIKDIMSAMGHVLTSLSYWR